MSSAWMELVRGRGRAGVRACVRCPGDAGPRGGRAAGGPSGQNACFALKSPLFTDSNQPSNVAAEAMCCPHFPRGRLVRHGRTRGCFDADRPAFFLQVSLSNMCSCFPSRLPRLPSRLRRNLLLAKPCPKQTTRAVHGFRHIALPLLLLPNLSCSFYQHHAAVHHEICISLHVPGTLALNVSIRQTHVPHRMASSQPRARPCRQKVKSPA